jgi:hypothetical protein
MLFVILRNMLLTTSKNLQFNHQLRWKCRLLKMLPRKKKPSIARSKIVHHQRKTLANGSNIKSLIGVK